MLRGARAQDARRWLLETMQKGSHSSCPILRGLDLSERSFPGQIVLEAPCGGAIPPGALDPAVKTDIEKHNQSVLRIQHCPELWCRSQTRLESHVAVAVA